MKSNVTITTAVLTGVAAILVSACASKTPKTSPVEPPKAKSGEQMLLESQNLAKFGERWKLGQQKVHEGEETVRQGRAKIEQGERLIEEGNRIMKESEESYEGFKK